MRYLLLLVIALMGSTAAHGDDLLDILQKLAAQPLLRAEFHQIKTLPALTRPLLSEGQLVVASGEGVLLLIRRPVPAQMVITPDVLLQKTAHTQTRLHLDQSPYGAVAGLIGQLMSGDVKQLQSAFAVEVIERNGAAWALQLRPRDGRLKKLFVTLRISGDDFLRELEISETAGGTTLMRVSEHRTLPAMLSEDERALFKLAY